MLKRITELCLTRQTLVLMALAAFLGAGVLAFLRLNIEAYPDPAPPMLESITQSPGQSAEEMERYITIPIEVAVAGMPGLQNVRSISLYGLSCHAVHLRHRLLFRDAADAESAQHVTSPITCSQRFPQRVVMRSFAIN
jgi:cobalt-zinc-cadmium resistance protein CzcA